MNAIIVEDEPAGRRLLQRMLAEHCPEVTILEAVSSAKEGRRAISEHHPDLVFLDIEMPGENGIAMLKGINPVDFQVIFVTAHSDYAIDAIRLSALDYLLKPVRSDELVAAVGRVRSMKDTASAGDQVQALFQNLTATDPKIAITTRKGIVFVSTSDIVRCESMSNYTRIHVVPGESYIASRTLKHFDELLAGRGFIRVHQTHLVNSRFIKEYIRGDGGTLVLQDGSTVDVSRRFKNRLLRAFDQV